MDGMNRDKTLDMLKAVSTVLVVFVHAGNLLDYAHVSLKNPLLDGIAVLANAGVPAFFLVSGYLLGIREFDWQKNIRKKTRTLLLPFLLWSVLYVIMEAIGHMLLPESFADVGRWSVGDWCLNLMGIPFYYPPIYAPFWFVRDLFFLNVMAGWIRKGIEKLPPVLFLMGVLLIWYLPLHGYFKQAFCFFPMGLWIGMKWKSSLITFRPS